MKKRYFALGIGIVYVVLAILGFIPALRSISDLAPSLAVGIGYGYLFGLFAVNLIHNLVWLGLGTWGIVAYRSEIATKRYARTIAIVFGLLAILGLIPFTNTLFGLMPIFGHNIWLHALTALIAAYFGFMSKLLEITKASAA
ncbi:MAG: DUF4383 domain-containing protein [Prochloraceae cyanobacterium]